MNKLLAIALIISIGVNMQFSNLIAKMAKGEQLSAVEQQQVVLEARTLEQAAYLLNTIIKPGTQTLKIDNAEFNSATINEAEINDAEINDATITNAEVNDADINNAEFNNVTIANEDVEIDEFGVFLKNQEGGIFFEDSAENRDNMAINASTSDDLQIVNHTPGQGIQLYARLTATDSYGVINFEQDPAQANRSRFAIGEGAQGTRLELKGAGSASLIDIRTQGSSGGSTFIRMMETANTPPAGSTDAFHMYMKGDKLIIQFDAAGTPHYFYLDLTATSNQSWVYSATAP